MNAINTVAVVTAGRTDVGEYFRRHLGAWKKLPRSPLLVFRQSDTAIAVEIVTQPMELLGFPDDTPVMGIWPGEWKSDYFQFTVGEYREFYVHA